MPGGHNELVEPLSPNPPVELMLTGVNPYRRYTEQVLVQRHERGARVVGKLHPEAERLVQRLVVELDVSDVGLATLSWGPGTTGVRKPPYLVETNPLFTPIK